MDSGPGLGRRLTKACRSAEVHRMTLWRAQMLLIEVLHWADSEWPGQVIAVDIARGLPVRYFLGDARCRRLPWPR